MLSLVLDVDQLSLSAADRLDKKANAREKKQVTRITSNRNPRPIFEKFADPEPGPPTVTFRVKISKRKKKRESLNEKNRNPFP